MISPLLLLLACTDGATDPDGHPHESGEPSSDTSADTARTDTAPTDTADVPWPALRISEVMSDNADTLTDGDGDSPDWIELYNPGPAPVDLAGWTLADDGAPWPLPTRTLPGGAFALIYASGKGDAGPDGELHTPFRLDAGGEMLTLSHPDGSVADTVDLPALPPDVSWGLEQVVTTVVAVGDGTRATLAEALPAEGDTPAWTGPAFDDAGWQDVILGVGFDGAATSEIVENAALDRPTTQSSDGYGYTGVQAVDGETSTFSHTGDADLSPAWSVDLESDYAIASIRLYNREGCCPERLYNIDVSVLDAAGAAVWRADTQNPVADGETPTDPGATLTLPVDPPVIGRSVRVDKTAVNGARSSEWLSLAEVVVGGRLASPYEDALATDLGAIDSDVVYVRAPFDLAAAPTRATLTMAYDDGFAAWVNGAAAATANMGGGIVAHDGADAEVYPLDPRALVAGANVLAIEGRNVTAADDDLLVRPTLALDWFETGGAAFFAVATPGAPNGVGVEGLVEAPTFDPPRGFHDAPFVATVTTATPGATLVYTLDGSAPTLDNGVVVRPADAATAPTVSLEVPTTTLLRAAAFRDTWAASSVVTHTYLFLADVITQPAAPTGLPTVWDGVSESPVAADYEMDPEIVATDRAELLEGLRAIPTLSLVMDPDDLFGADGLYVNSAERGEAWERAASVEWIEPDGATGFAETCGVRVHGYGWRYHSATKKHSLRLEFRREYGASRLEYPVFADAPVDRFDSIVLRAGGSKTWLDFRDPAQAQYLHDSFARDTARDMGKPDGHATYVHLYLNGLYWGLYNPVERPEADFGEAYFGGDASEYDAINRRTTMNEAIDGTLDAYNALLALAEEDLSTSYADVEAMLAIDDLIDYMLIHQYTVNRDGPCCAESNNMRGLRRRLDGEPFRFFVWDMEYSLWDAADATNVDIDVSGSISHVYTRLRTNADFRARYAERARTHLTGTGALTPAATSARYAARAEEIYGPLLAESARWGDTYRATPYRREVEWQAEYDRLQDEFFPYRTEALIAQLTAAGLYTP